MAFHLSFSALVCVYCVCVHRCSVVKEELSDDEAHLPCFNGRVVSWVSSDR